MRAPLLFYEDGAGCDYVRDEGETHMATTTKKSKARSAKPAAGAREDVKRAGQVAGKGKPKKGK